MSIKIIFSSVLLLIAAISIYLIFEWKEKNMFWVKSDQALNVAKIRMQYYDLLNLGENKKAEELLDSMILSDVTTLSFVIIESDKLLQWFIPNSKKQKQINKSCKVLIEYENIIKKFSKEYEYYFDSYNLNALHKCQLDSSYNIKGSTSPINN